MYQRILLAYDGSVEGRAALREGALLARRWEAQVFLLSVIQGGAGVQMGEAGYAGAVQLHEGQVKSVFEEGVARLRQLGFRPMGRLVQGEPTEEICKYAKEIAADLVVVGHRRRGMIERWWSGSSGAILSDRLDCSLLISRNTVSDAAFEVAMKGSSATAAPA